jgi:hypothetical protein
MKFLNKSAQEEAFLRGLDILPEILALKKYGDKSPVDQETRDISRQQFLIGILRYLIGFYEDSIYYTTLSVELGLLIRLDEELSTAQKEEIHAKINSKEHPLSFTFGYIFGMCKKRELGIIKETEICEKVDDIIATRNTHIHASNINSASILSMKESGIPEIEKTLKEIDIIKNNPIANLLTKKWLSPARELIDRSNKSIIDLSTLEWCTRDRERIRAKKKLDEFFNQVFGKIDDFRNTPDTLSQKLNLGLHSGKLVKSFSQESFFKTIALSTIKNTYEVLRAVGILEKTSDS